MRRIWLVTLAAVWGLTLWPSPAAAGLFRHWETAAYWHQDMDVSEGRLYSAGLMFGVVADLTHWERGRLELHLDGLLGGYGDHARGVEMGLVPGLRLCLTRWGVEPYLEAGIGPSYNTLHIPALGMSFNFLSYAGLGLRIPLQGGRHLELGWRVRHISNAGLDERNHGVTSSQLQVGVSFTF
jgi:hypothetical protein